MALFSKWKEYRSSERKSDEMLYNNRIERMRTVEFPMLRGTTYLDHGGTTLASRSMLQSFCKAMQGTLLANPHSDAVNPSASSIIVAETRQKVLRFFNADPEHFDVVFTANATAAIKLVMECLLGHEGGFDYYYHRNSHTSLVGLREVAHQSRCLASDEETEKWLEEPHDNADTNDHQRPTLFAYPAQSNMNGQRLPLHWPGVLRNSKKHPKSYTLLDAAALVSTSSLDLSDAGVAPDFVALSFYKIFGFPDLGALIVRKASAPLLEHRRYFGGGTTDMITVFEESPWVARKQEAIHARLEDGTIAIRSILALRCALDTHLSLFGGMQDISKHTGWLAKMLFERLNAIRHGNGVPVCHIYKATGSTYGDTATQGATIAMNIQKSNNTWVNSNHVGSVLRAHNIQVRTGGLCNPAGMAHALNFNPDVMRRMYTQGYRCNNQDTHEREQPLGMVRITLGAMSTLQDIETLSTCIEALFVEKIPAWRNVVTSETDGSSAGSREKSTSLRSHGGSSVKPDPLVPRRNKQTRSFRKWLLNCFI